MKVVHMDIGKNVYNQGWTLCHGHSGFKRTTNWKKVTCKQCLKHKPKENK